MGNLVGVLILRNGVKLGYPFELAIRSLQRVCPVTVVSVDPTSEDDSVQRVQALQPTHVYLSEWDMCNHHGDGGDEVSIQTKKVCDWVHATLAPEWIFSLQADEILHENDVEEIQASTLRRDADAFTLSRLYFYGGLHQIRTNWTLPISRLFRPQAYTPDFYSGAMTFIPREGFTHREQPLRAAIYHYSRVGDPLLVAQRGRNLDTFYHPPGKVLPEAQVAPYNFSVLRRLDSYLVGAQVEADPVAVLTPFPVQGHPAGVAEYFNA